MARHAEDREDLYLELKQASIRWEISLAGTDVPVVAGLRGDGRFAIYFTPDLVCQFDSQYRLVRAYRAGDLYRTQGTTLARLRRASAPSESVLLRHDLRMDERSAFFVLLREELHKLEMAIASEQATVLRSSSPAPNPLEAFQKQINSCLCVLGELAPPFRTRRS